MQFNQVDERIYKAFLTLLKEGSAFNISSVAREAGVHRKTIYNKIDNYTFQDLDKFRSTVL